MFQRKGSILPREYIKKGDVNIEEHKVITRYEGLPVQLKD